MMRYGHRGTWPFAPVENRGANSGSLAAADPACARRGVAAALSRPAASRWAKARALCAPCWSKLSPIERPFCEKLGIPFTYDPGPGVYSMQAIADPPAYARARAAVRYDEVARTLVHALKYGDRLDLAPIMGALDGAGRRRPARRRRCHRAGAAALAAAVGAALQPVGGSGEASSRAGMAPPVSVTALKRVKATPQQVGLSRAAARRQCPGRLPGRRRRQGRDQGPAPAAGGRRADLRRDRGCLRPRAAARRRPAGGCAGFRAGCGPRTHAHIVPARRGEFANGSG